MHKTMIAQKDSVKNYFVAKNQFLYVQAIPVKRKPPNES